MFKTLVALLFTLILALGVPALSYSTARNSEIRHLPRLSLYLSAVISQWILTVAGLAVALLAAPEILVKGFAWIPWSLILGSGAGIAAVSLLGLCVVIWLERRGWLPPEGELVHLLIPATPREKLWSVLIVSPTAAFCEEFLYRGFLLSQLHFWLHSLLWAWVLSCAVFGLAHYYQGWSGMTRAALLGALLTYPVARWGSLYPAMLAHWLIDTAALLCLGNLLKERIRRAPEPTGPEL